ncbi:MAG: hypothetical protein EHM12_10095 [Dehalococcoidia bacterium]|nr:MAG: hypothetical protein EHM12_10095 [Dehalococcoidia bacterium]
MNNELNRLIIAAGQQAGLFLDEDKMRRLEQEGEPNDLRLTAPVIFTLRPVDEYLSHYRGSWTRIQFEARPVGEIGDDGRGVGLVFEARFGLAYAEGDSPIDPGLIIEEILARLEDFARSYPDEAALLFVDPLTWEMSIEGEIIYELQEGHAPFLDFGMYPELGLNVWVYETTDEAAFEQALFNLSDDTALGQALHDMLRRLALLGRWLDIEAPPQPPLLDLWGEDF